VRSSDCEADQQKWLNAVELLKNSMEACRLVKEESVAPRIEEDVAASKGNVPLARTVRAVLQERRQKVAEAEDVCRRQAETERFAFERWYSSCNGGGRTKRGAPVAGELRQASAERDRLRKYLNELLMDEAYAQYRNARPQTERAAEPEEPPQLNAGYRTDRGAGYGGSGYRPGGSQYQGYYR